jgi:uncharacterized protein
MARKIIVHNSDIHGRGVFAASDISSGTKIIEYKGRLLSSQQAAELYGDNTEHGHTFLFTLNDKWLVDGGVDGNSARFINHSCDPNCEAVVYVNKDYIEEKDKLWIEAVRDIREGEELSFDYGIKLAQRHTARLKKVWKCLCGSAKCTGTMLKDKQ